MRGTGQEGKFGQLYDMDSNPKLDIDFPTGTLRMLGTHVHTKTKLMTLQPAKGGKRMQAYHTSLSSPSSCASSPSASSFLHSIYFKAALGRRPEAAQRP
jgi:hypothetical protein